MKLVVSILSIWLLTQSVFSQGAMFQVETNRKSILIGEQVLLNIELRASAADTLTLPVFTDTLTKNIEIIAQSAADTSFEGDNLEQRVLRQELTLTSFDSGHFAVAPLVAMVNGFPVESNPFLITVESVAIDTAKGIYDIRGIAEVPFSFSEWLAENWAWVAFGFLILLAFAAFIIWYKRRPEQIVEEVIVPKRPAHEIAFERLDKLVEQKLWQAEDVKRFYSELTDILREYIENRYSIPALEQTTDEILQSMRRRADFDEALIGKTKNVLFLADLVKFAKEKPVGSENEMNLNEVRSFVMETKTSTVTEVNTDA